MLNKSKILINRVSAILALTLFFIFTCTQSLIIAQDNNKLTILFTSDIHSNAQPKPISYSEPYYKNDSVIGQIVGGYARLKTIINREKQIAQQDSSALIVVDAGDIAMGTPFQTLFTYNGFDLVSLGKMGFDATIFGNHDFDFGVDSTAYMLKQSLLYKDSIKLPYLLSSNLFPTDKNNIEIFNEYGVKPAVLIEKENIKIGIIGSYGINSYSVTSVKDGLKFIHPEQVLQNVVDSLKYKGAEYIILLSHGGTLGKNGNKTKSEDVQLASKINGIDVLISGHDHDILNDPLIIKNTIIAVPGAYNNYIGKIVVNAGELDSYSLIPILDTITPCKEIDTWVSNNQIIANEKFYNSFGINLLDTIANVERSYSREFDDNGNLDLGYHIAKSYSLAVNKNKALDSVIGIVPHGVIRSSLEQGCINHQDIFNILSLGNNSSGDPGYPLVLAWINGKELKDLCELVATISPGLEDSRLYFYGVNYRYNPLKIPFTKVVDVEVFGNEINYNKLYPIVTGLYTANLIGLLKSESFGLLSAQPKDSLGNVIENINDYILSESLPEWLAFANYIKDGSLNENKKISGAIKHHSYIIYLEYFLILLAIIVFVRILLKLFRKR